MSVCVSRKELFFLGAGFPMFFQFIILSIGLLLLIFLLSSLFNVATNLKLDACEGGDLFIHGKICVPTWWIRISLLSKYGHDNFLSGQGINNLITVICAIIYLQFFRYKQRVEADSCDEKLISASDFAIEVRGLPLTDNLQDIRREFERKLEHELGYKFHMMKLVLVNRSFTISDLVEILNKNAEFVKKKTKLDRWITLKEGENIKKSMKLQKNEKQLNSLKIELNKFYKERNLLEIDLKTTKESLATKKNLFKNQLKFTGTAYIVFQLPEQAKRMRKLLTVHWLTTIKIYLKKLICLENQELYKNSYFLNVKRAPEPNDIIWENLDVPEYKKFLYIALTNLATLFLLAVSFSLVVGVTFIQRHLQINYEEEMSFLALQAVNMMGAVLITVINQVMHEFIEIFTKYERPSTHTNFDSSLAEKKVMALFMNTSIIYILVSWSFDNFVGKNGLVDSLLYIFLSNMSVTSFLVFIDIGYQIKKFKRWIYEKSSWVLLHSDVTQQEANLIYEGSTLNIPSCYGAILNVMLFSGFYASVVPLGPLLGIITLIIYYWVFKYTLLINSKMPKALGKRVSMEMIEFTEYVPLLLALGDFIFVKIFYQQNSIFNLIAIILCCVNFLLPMKYINKRLIKIKKDKNSDSEEKNYFDIRNTLQFEYERCNPVTKKKVTECIRKKKSSEVDENEDELKDLDIGDLEKYSKENENSYFKKKTKDDSNKNN